MSPCCPVSTAMSFLSLFLPSQPEGGTIDVGALGLDLPGLILNAPCLSSQALMDVRGHGEESFLHVLRALRARLQEGDLQGGGQVLVGRWGRKKRER